MADTFAPQLRFGIDHPAQLLGDEWKQIVSYEYADMAKICGCETFLEDTDLNSKFTCAIVNKDKHP